MATAKVYPNGFNYNSFAKAYLYNPAAFNFNPGLLQLNGAGITLTNLMTVSGSTATGANASLSLSSTKGTFKGSFTIPPGKTKIPFNGVFLQPENVATGYFLNGTQSGQVSFGPPN